MAVHSTGYVLGFSAAVCLACAVFVAGSAVSLKERQEVNELVAKRTQVLDVAGLIEPDEKGKLKADDVAKRFEAVVPILVNLDTGEVLPAADGAEGSFSFDGQTLDPSTYDQQAAAKDKALGEEAPANDAKVLRLPKVGLVYHVMQDGEITKLILPVEGYGLWGTLYGFLALEPDTQTISGLTFYKHQETPGLGGEVDNPNWKALWKGRKAFSDDWEPTIEVIKGPAGPADQAPYSVDGLSGATLTSRGVTNLLRFWLGEHGYGPYLASFRDKGAN